MNTRSDHAAAPLAREGKSCWRRASADRAAIIVDAANYFRTVKAAMLEAEHVIMLEGWDFDARIKLEPDEKTLPGPNKIGPFLKWLARRKPELQIYLLKWDIGMMRSLSRGETPLSLLGWLNHDNMHLKLDGAHHKLAAHHMKLVVIDDALAFCGGIDVTEGRWDTRDHVEGNPARRSATMGKKLGPWHDATSCVSGPMARVLGDLARQRWERATGERLEPPEAVTGRWCTGLAPDFSDIEVAVARTIARYKDYPQISEIEALTFEVIRAAQKTLYIESQYLASRHIAEALAERLAEPEGPEIVVINPDTADGWLESKAMDSARVRLLSKLRKADRYDRFRLYYPVNAAGTPIYVHAKIMIADDRVFKIGSANLNNRSMGYDTECDLLIDAQGQPESEAVRRAIAGRRHDLVAEHLDTDADTVAAEVETRGSLIAAIEALNTRERHLEPLQLRPLTAGEEMIEETDLVDPERPAKVADQLGQVLARFPMPGTSRSRA